MKRQKSAIFAKNSLNDINEKNEHILNDKT